MTDTDSQKTEPTPPVVLTVTGVGSIPTGTIAVTPGRMPDVVLRVIPPIVTLGVRFANLFFVSLSGFLAVAVPAGILPPHGAFEQCVKLALCAAGVGFIKDCATIFSNLEKTHPLSTGSI